MMKIIADKGEASSSEVEASHKDSDLKTFLKIQQQQQQTFLEKLYKGSAASKPTKLFKVSTPPAWTKDVSFDINDGKK